MKFPAECKTAEDRAEFCEQLKRELIADHAKASASGKREIELQLRIVGYHGAKAREECGASIEGFDGTTLSAIKTAAKAERFKIEPEHKDIDYARDVAATRG